MIIATAGHVDHGKTSLIKQLTGVDTDRLEEEKKRGLSINLGYAYLPVGGGSPIGFIDVPGHHRFINTMIAGVSGIDLGMLVVAADDGPMPQTVEHLDVLQLLGVQGYLLIVSKIDRVEAGRAAEVETLALNLLSQRGARAVPVFRVSNRTGQGVDELRAFLVRQSATRRTGALNGQFRLSIDRSFHLKGTGLVVTGTATAGVIARGDQLLLLPQNKTLKVRGLHVQDEAAERAHAGQRCALNVGGDIERAEIERGDWLVLPEAGPTTQRLDARVELLAGLAFPLRHRSPVRLHIGAKRVAGKLYLLGDTSDKNKLSPSENALAQLILWQPVSCVIGERFLLRDDSESITLGGGVVLDPCAPRSGKASRARLRYLQAMEQANPGQALNALVGTGEPVDFSRFAASWNLTSDEAQQMPGDDVYSFAENNRDYLIADAVWRKLLEQITASLSAWHNSNPGLTGLQPAQWRKALALTASSSLLKAALAELLKNGTLRLREGLVGLAGGGVTPGEGQRNWQKIEALLRERGFDIPLRAQLAEATGLVDRKVESACNAAVGKGLAFALTPGRCALRHTVSALAHRVLAMDRRGEPITVVNFKTRMGTGRKVAIEVLEYFDRIGFTQRNDDLRVVLNPELPAKLFSD